MLILNFAHPLTDDQTNQIERLTETKITRIIHQQPQFVQTETLTAQTSKLVDAVDLTTEEWQTEPLLINPPGLAPAAACLTAEIHGRCGYFPPMILIQRNDETTLPRFDVTEILNLQQLRENARTKR